MPTLPISQAIVDVVAFIDWNAQLLLTKKNSTKDPVGTADAALKQTARRVARCLGSIDTGLRFRVSLRLYHGWHKGFEPTDNRKAVRTILAKADFATLSQRTNVVFSPIVEFGDRLMYASAVRLNSRLDCHLPNTYRSRFGTEFEEKMVDTALASDVVASAYRESSNWILIVTEDDDFIPPAYVAESVFSGTKTRAIILQKNARASLLSLKDILING